jgi:hypothetical protein
MMFRCTAPGQLPEGVLDTLLMFLSFDETRFRYPTALFDVPTLAWKRQRAGT